MLVGSEPTWWTTHGSDRWEVIIEPDEVDLLLVVVTAYRVETAR